VTAAPAPESTVVALTVNGEPVEVRTPGGRRLLDVLRDDLGLTGTKEGCGEGECGACSVILDGEVVDSCLVPVGQADGCAVRTVEGLGRDGRLGPLQEAFLDAGAAQCGICTPGMLMAAEAFLASGAPATDTAIREAIAGNLCRCTGYTKIVEAIADAAAAGRVDGPPVTGAGATRRATAPGWARPDLIRPGSLGEALALLAERPALRPVAGGTDLMVALASGALARDEPLLDLWPLDELRGVRAEGDAVVLGALTTYADLRRSPLVAGAVPVLAGVAATIGAAQIQSRGTIGGNVVNASPAGDTLPVLLATDASIVLTSTRGERTVPANGFFTGYRTTARAPDELVARVVVPAGRRVRFRKVGTRRALAISKAVIAVSWREDGPGAAWTDVRVAVGSVAEVPLRAPAAEAALEGETPSAATAERAAAAVAGDVRPIDDVRSTAEYRRAVTSRVLRRIVLDAAAG
jgi:carbon-monoxide dehydrogenase small subunit/xanthine dehydrogenase small subunit